MTKDKDESTGSMVAGILFAFAVVVPLMGLRGWAIIKLWTWFVVPLGVAALPMASAIGISTLVSLLTADLAVKREDEKGVLRGAVMWALKQATLCLVAVAAGAFAKWMWP